MSTVRIPKVGEVWPHRRSPITSAEIIAANGDKVTYYKIWPTGTEAFTLHVDAFRRFYIPPAKPEIPTVGSKWRSSVISRHGPVTVHAAGDWGVAYQWADVEFLQAKTLDVFFACFEPYVEPCPDVDRWANVGPDADGKGGIRNHFASRASAERNRNSPHRPSHLLHFGVKDGKAFAELVKP